MSKTCHVLKAMSFHQPLNLYFLFCPGPRRFPSREGEQSCDHLHRRDRRHRHQTLRRADRRRSRGPEDPPRTSQPDGRI
jgi:hypothetical protein